MTTPSTPQVRDTRPQSAANTTHSPTWTLLTMRVPH